MRDIWCGDCMSEMQRIEDGAVDMVLCDLPYGMTSCDWDVSLYCGDSNHVKLGKVKRRYDPDKVQPSTVLDFKVVPNRNGKLHPTQKPVELCEYLIKTYTHEGDLILDNCAGSGTTLVAARNTGRRFIGIEQDAGYYAKAVARIHASIA